MTLPGALAADGSPSAPARDTGLDALRDRAIEASISEGHPSATILSPFRAPIRSGASDASSSSGPTLMQELSQTVKETVRPTYVEALNSGVVEAIRSVASNANPDPSHGFSDVNPDAQKEVNRRPPETEGRTWDTSNGSNRTLSPQEKAADQAGAEIMLRALIDEIKPWAFSVAGLYGLYQLVKLGLAYLRHKSGRHRRRHRSGSSSSRGRSHRHRSHSAPQSAPVKLDHPDQSPMNSPTP